MEHIIQNTAPYEATMTMNKIMGSQVLSSKGLVVGKVTQMRINPKNLELEGILVKRGSFKKPLFIGKTYFKSLSSESIILSIEPSVLFKGKKVLSNDGQFLGRLKAVNRKIQTNEIDSIVVKSTFRKPQIILSQYIDSTGSSVILKDSYHGKSHKEQEGSIQRDNNI
ncbi:hypothetical protein ACFL1B_04030 [Nanoarchaeota archaeon]